MVEAREQSAGSQSAERLPDHDGSIGTFMALCLCVGIGRFKVDFWTGRNRGLCRQHAPPKRAGTCMAINKLHKALFNGYEQSQFDIIVQWQLH